MDDTVNDKGLPGFGVGLEELLDEEGPGRKTYADVRDGRVCACGHPMTRHQESDLREVGRGIVRSCNPVRMTCPCTDPKPVVTAADTRPFLHKTKGYGRKHALMLGLTALLAKNRAFDWLPGSGWPRCDLKGGGFGQCSGEGLMPYCFSARKQMVSFEPEALTVMLCPGHLEKARIPGGVTF